MNRREQRRDGERVREPEGDRQVRSRIGKAAPDATIDDERR
jgi:hypothetical protein